MTNRQQPKECYDGTPCIDGKSDACNICYIPLQCGEKVSCKLHTICRYCVNDCFNYNPDYKCDFDTRTHTPAAPATEPWCYPGCMLVYKAKEQGRKDGAKAEREQAAKRVDAFADSLHDLESIVIKGGLRELAESLRGGAR